MQNQKMAFTLVELIVVITILSILSAIAFISLTGYGIQTRDSTRVTDINSIKTSLELFQLESGKYPLPTNAMDILYSGSIVWNQGTFGETTYDNVLTLDKMPVDPLLGKEYTYSLTVSKSEYQLGGIIEGDVVSYSPSLTTPYQAGGLAQKVQAGETTAMAYVTGNYNGIMVKILSGEICNVLSIPSIMTNDLNLVDLQEIITDKYLVYNGYKNLPSSFRISKFLYDGGFDFRPNKLLSYSDTGSCLALIDKSNSKARIELIKGLQESYSGTVLQNEGEIKNILDLNINTNNPSDKVVQYAANFINNIFGTDLDYINSISNSYQCNGLYGNTNPNQWGEFKNFPSFNLCLNTLVYNSIDNFDISNKLTGNLGAREVYAFVLESGKTYTIETLGDDEYSDTAIFLYDNHGNRLVMNDDIDITNSRSKVVYNPTHTGYYFLGVMGFDDLGTVQDYVLNITTN